MSALDDEGRPVLRIVRSDEVPSDVPELPESSPASPVTTPPPSPPLPAPQSKPPKPTEEPTAEPLPAAAAPSPEREHFERAARSLDVGPLAGALLVLAGLRMASEAVAIHEVSARARPELARGGATPGRRPAEATRAWLFARLADVRASGRTGRDVLDAAIQAAADLDEATLVSVRAGLWIDARRRAAMTAAVDTLAWRPRPPKSSSWLSGLDVLGV